MNEKYLHHYRILGLAPGCTQKELKAAYHRLARKWHPDRHVERPAASRGRRSAEERIKEINHAYWSLSDHYRKHGRLPLEPVSPASQTFDGAPSDPEHSSSAGNVGSARNSSSYWRYLFIGMLLGIGFVIWHNRPATETVTLPSSPGAVDESQPPGKEYFSVGSRIGDVYAAQGAPTKTEGDVWHYGKSRIYFSKGRVTRWVEDSNHPLMVSRIEEADNEASPPANGFFSIGSTKQEVRAIQGKPLRETDTLWEYRVSRVYFKNDRVTSWYSSPVDPLRARSK